MGREHDGHRIRIRHGKEVVRHTDRQEETVCEQSSNRHADVGLIGTQSLVNRKHALDTGLQSTAGPDKTQVGKSRQKP